MPFRCKCGRTFEKTDSFASHTSACAPFHQRRMSENSVFQQQQQQLRQQQRQSPPPSINTSSTLSFIPNALFSPLSPTAPTSPSSPGSASSGNGTALTAVDETFDRGGAASSMPSFFMPTGLSLHNAFEGARRRSMSYGSTNATSLK